MLRYTGDPSPSDVRLRNFILRTDRKGDVLWSILGGKTTPLDAHDIRVAQANIFRVTLSWEGDPWMDVLPLSSLPIH